MCLPQVCSDVYRASGKNTEAAEAYHAALGINAQCVDAYKSLEILALGDNPAAIAAAVERERKKDQPSQDPPVHEDAPPVESSQDGSEGDDGALGGQGNSQDQAHALEEG